MIFVDTTGPFPETLIGNCYWTGIADDYKCYFWSIYKNMKLQLLKKIGEFFEKWHNVVLQLTTHVVIIPGDTDQLWRRCVEKKRQCWSTKNLMRPIWMALLKEELQSTKKEC